jgi:DNA-binding transcriptional regulator GbsR (MarR family)
LQGPEQTPPDAKKLDRQNQAEIKADVQKLYELIGELKEQVERSDTNSTLSLSVVKKAQQIEKLAKQVKDRAKG